MESWINVEPDRYLHNSRDTVTYFVLLASLAAESWTESPVSCQHSPLNRGLLRASMQKDHLAERERLAWDTVKHKLQRQAVR